jgi:hypothetical protein
VKPVQTIGQRLRGEPPDPIAARLLGFALEHKEDLLGALDDARRVTGAEPSALGLLLVGEATGLPLPPGSVVVHTRERLWSITRNLRLDVPQGVPGFFPVLVAHRNEVCLCWLGPAPAAGLAS